MLHLDDEKRDFRIKLASLIKEARVFVTTVPVKQWRPHWQYQLLLGTLIRDQLDELDNLANRAGLPKIIWNFEAELQAADIWGQKMEGVETSSIQPPLLGVLCLDTNSYKTVERDTDSLIGNLERLLDEVRNMDYADGSRTDLPKEHVNPCRTLEQETVQTPLRQAMPEVGLGEHSRTMRKPDDRPTGVTQSEPPKTRQGENVKSAGERRIGKKIHGRTRRSQELTVDIAERANDLLRSGDSRYRSGVGRSIHSALAAELGAETWAKITFLAHNDPDKVKVRTKVKGTGKSETITVTAERLGMLDNRTKKPNTVFAFLRDIISKEGGKPLTPEEYDKSPGTFRKNIERLNRALCRAFGIDSNPIENSQTMAQHWRMQNPGEPVPDDIRGGQYLRTFRLAADVDYTPSGKEWDSESQSK